MDQDNLQNGNEEKEEVENPANEDMVPYKTLVKILWKLKHMTEHRDILAPMFIPYEIEYKNPEIGYTVKVPRQPSSLLNFGAFRDLFEHMGLRFSGKSVERLDEDKDYTLVDFQGDISKYDCKVLKDALFVPTLDEMRSGKMSYDIAGDPQNTEVKRGG